MKADWEVKKLKDICEKDSSNVNIKDLVGLEGEYPIYGASGLIQNINFYHQEEEYIGIIKDGSGIGRTMLLPSKSSVIGTIQYILPKKGNSIHFINYALQSLDLSKYKQGAAIPHIYFRDYGETELVVPPLPEQKRIVEILNQKFVQIDQLKQNAEKNLQNAKELFQAELTKAFSNNTWEKKRLGDVCGITSKLVDPTQSEYLDLYHVGGANIVSETGKIIDLKTSKEEGLSSGKFTFDNSMVLYNKIRPYLKKVARPNFSGLCSADMYPLSPKSSIEKDFLYYVLISKSFTDYAISKSDRAGMPKVNRDALFSFSFPLPPLSEQQKIVAHLDALQEKVRQLEEIYTKQIANCDELKQSFLKKAFEGEL